MAELIRVGASIANKVCHGPQDEQAVSAALPRRIRPQRASRGGREGQASPPQRLTKEVRVVGLGRRARHWRHGDSAEGGEDAERHASTGGGTAASADGV